MTIADTIWQQITRDTKMAVGARDAMGDDTGVTFKVTITRGQTHKVKVAYNKGADDYTITLYHIRGTTVKEPRKAENVGVENLNRVIYDFCHNK